MYKINNECISHEHYLFLKKIRQNKVKIIATQIFILIFFFVFWEIAADYRLIDSFIMSQPSRIIKTLLDLYSQKQLFNHIAITCAETIIGLVLGTILGTLTAIVLWWSEFISKVLEPYLVVLNSLPKIALGPIFIIWVGAGPAAIIIIALTISIVVTILEVLNGFLEVDKEKIKLVKTFGASKLQIFTKVIMPSSTPTIINTLKVNIGLSWVGVIVGEFLVSRAGLGYLIVYGGQVFQLDLVMSSILILAVAAAGMYQLITHFEKKLIKHKQ